MAASERSGGPGGNPRSKKRKPIVQSDEQIVLGYSSSASSSTQHGESSGHSRGNSRKKLRKSPRVSSSSSGSAGGAGGRHSSSSTTTSIKDKTEIQVKLLVQKA